MCSAGAAAIVQYRITMIWLRVVARIHWNTMYLLCFSISDMSPYAFQMVPSVRACARSEIQQCLKCNKWNWRKFFTQLNKLYFVFLFSLSFFLPSVPCAAEVSQLFVCLVARRTIEQNSQCVCASMRRCTIYMILTLASQLVTLACVHTTIPQHSMANKEEIYLYISHSFCATTANKEKKEKNSSKRKVIKNYFFNRHKLTERVCIFAGCRSCDRHFFLHCQFCVPFQSKSENGETLKMQ